MHLIFFTFCFLFQHHIQLLSYEQFMFAIFCHFIAHHNITVYLKPKNVENFNPGCCGCNWIQIWVFCNSNYKDFFFNLEMSKIMEEMWSKISKKKIKKIFSKKIKKYLWYRFIIMLYLIFKVWYYISKQKINWVFIFKQKAKTKQFLNIVFLQLKSVPRRGALNDKKTCL